MMFRGVVLGLLFSVGLMSCTDNFDSLNTPDDRIFASEINDARLGKIFAVAQRRGYSAREGGLSFQLSENLFADEYAQYFTTTEANFQSAQNFIVGSWNSMMFDHFYANVATQLTFVEDYTAENNMTVENAIAQIWRVHAYHRMTDFYGPVMYSEVGNTTTFIAYDPQEEIYMDFFETLDSAVATLESSSAETAAYAQNDLIYSGDVEQWIKFANSLRLRLAMRIRYVEPTMAQDEAETAVAAGVIEDNADNALMLTTENSIHGYPAITYIDEFRTTSTLVNTMVSYDDPRISLYMDETTDEDAPPYRGVRSGLPVGEKGQTLNPLHSRIGLYWRPTEVGGANPDIEVMKASEVYFLRAEGALEGWNMGGGTAEQYYEEGIRASMTESRFTIDTADIDAYINNTSAQIAVPDQWNSPPMTDIPVAFGQGSAAGDEEKQLEQIITQKFLAMYPDGAFEAWAERRRTGYPIGYAIIETLDEDVPRNALMRRIPFTSNERSNNSEAVENAIQLLDGPDSPATRVWWDAKELPEYPTPVD